MWDQRYSGTKKCTCRPAFRPNRRMATVSFKMRAFDEGELALIDGNVRSLDLSSCSLNELPCAVRGLAVSLEVLNVTWNQLSNLPEWFGELHALKYFDCSFNRLESLPNSLSKLSRLKELHLSDNNLRQFHEIEKLTALTSLSLQYNKLEYIPTSLSQLSQLRILNVNGNPLDPASCDFQQGGQSTNSLDNNTFSWPLEINGPRWRAETEARGRSEQRSTLLTPEYIGHVRPSAAQLHQAIEPSISPERSRHSSRSHLTAESAPQVFHGRAAHSPNNLRTPSSPPSTPPPLRVSLPTGLGEWVSRAASGAMGSRSVQDAVSLARMLAPELQPRASLPLLHAPGRRAASASRPFADPMAVTMAVTSETRANRRGRHARATGTGSEVAKTLADSSFDLGHGGEDCDPSAREGVCSQFLCPITREVGPCVMQDLRYSFAPNSSVSLHLVLPHKRRNPRPNPLTLPPTQSFRP